MELTLEQIKSWEAHPVTKELMGMMSKEIKAVKDAVRYKPNLKLTIDEVALNGAYSEGIIVGVNALQDICNSLKFLLTEDDDDAE